MYDSIDYAAPGVVTACSAVLLPCLGAGTPEKPAPEYWVEIIRIAPELIAAVTAAVVIYAYRKDVRSLIQRLTKFKGAGIEAEFSDKALSDAIVAHGVTTSVTEEQKNGALRRLQSVAPLIRDARFLWVDDQPESTRNERALLDNLGARNTTVTNSADARKELKENVYVAVITDLKREDKDTEGLNFANSIANVDYAVPVIAYTGANQAGRPRPANLFAITNRPDELVQYLCDVIERAKI